MRRTSWCLLSPSSDAHSFARSFSTASLQPTLPCDCRVPLAACRLLAPYAALEGAKRRILPLKHTHHPPSSQQSTFFVHIIQPLCHYIMLSPAFIHCCPTSPSLTEPVVPALTLCWSHSCLITSRSPPVLCPAPRPPSQGQDTLIAPRPLNTLTQPFIRLASLLHKLPQLTMLSCSCQHLG